MAAKVRVGVIGAGAIGPAHLKGYLETPGAELVAVCDLHTGRAKQAAGKFGVPRVFADYRKMLAADVVDAVSVCTPNNTHLPITLAALRAGKHVLCEKPIAVNGLQARRMVEAAKKAKRILMTAQSMRYGGSSQVLKQLAGSGRFGRLYYGKGMLLRRTGIPKGWFQDVKQSGGGPLIDIGVHVLDLLWWLMGTPKPVSAYGVTFDLLGTTGQGKGDWGVNYSPGKFSVEDLAAGLIRFESGQAISLDASWAAHTDDNYLVRLFGTKGGAQLTPEFVLYEMAGDTKLDAKVQAPAISGHVAEVQHFVDCIRRGREPISPGSQSVVVMDMLMAVYKSARTGRAVAL
jgi:predicted dehydrogenase